MKNSPITAAELRAQLEGDPKWVAENEKREQHRLERVEGWRRAEAPLVRKLNDEGIRVSSVWDLASKREPYPAAVPILLAHLTQPYPERVREGIARSLAVPYAKRGWQTVLKVFREEPHTLTAGVKWALALALGAMGTDKVLPDVIQLVLDKSLGRNRVPLIPVLGKSRNPQAWEVLKQLRDDETIGKEVGRALKRLEMKKPVTLRSIAEK